MASILCQKCGRTWTDELDNGAFSARAFSTPNNTVGSYLSVRQILDSGEAMLSCPSDPMPELDAAIQRKGQGPRSRARVTGRRDPTRSS